ncbi:lysophospholipid acyltransferase family protein [Planctomonas psychrotolerans]|uniref:lysophospholipid acyltransferase family protein n=1 Tax=Planctomonas psychrotolerans TaxID=2528712 RepID=UPI0012384E2E|nr:lysophospholipid acyltransferase family protein [Planctomonas psychrotolerans]
MQRSRREPIYSTAVAAGRALFGLLRLRRIESGLENLPRNGGAVIAMTHFGYLDFALVEWVLWLHCRGRVRFLAKQSVFDKPVLGWLLRGMRHIPVDMQAGADAYARAAKALRKGELIGVFPEAGVSASFTVRELKTGAVRLAGDAGVPVIPVAVWGGHRLLTKNRRIRFRERFGVPVSFAVGQPIEIHPGDNVTERTTELRSTLQALVHGLQAEYPVDGTGTWWQPRESGGTAPTPEEAAAADEERRLRREREARARAR